MRKKKIIGIILAAVLVAAGLGGVAYAAEPVNEVHVAFQTLYEYHAPGDSFTNASVSCQRGWNSGLRNEPDDSGLPVKDATLTLASEHKFDRVNPEPKTMGPPSYEWLFSDVPEGFWGEIVSVGFYEDLVFFTPGFDASRSVNQTEFLASGTQTLTITVTAQQSLLDLNVQVNAPEDQYVNPMITLPITPITGEADEIHLSDDGHQLFIGIHNPFEGNPYTFQVNIEVVLKPGVTKVEFMPQVGTHSQQEVTSGTTTDSSITHPMPEVGTWTWSATGTYLWDWHEIELGVIFFDYYSRVNNKVQAQCSTHYHYDVLEDTFENQPVEGKKDWCTSLGNWVDETHESVKAVTLTLDSGQEFGYIWPEENLRKTGPTTWEWSFGDVPEGSGVEGRVGSVPVTFTPGISATRAVEPTVFSEPGTQTLVITVTPAEDITNEQLVILVDAFDQPQASSVITEVTAEGEIRQSEHHVNIELREVPAGTTCTATIKIQVTPEVPKVEFIPQVAIIRVPFIPTATIMSSSVTLTSEIGTWTWRADGSYEWEVNASEWIHRSLEWEPSCREIVNAPPVAEASVDPYVAPVDSVFTFDGSASYDPDGTIASYDWDFGDGNSDSGVSVTHTYSAIGLYDVVLTVTDDIGAKDTDTVMVVVYDPEAGFATGGGWIYSDAGADRMNPSAEGKATFGFVSKYKKGANVPTGQTEFQFKAGDLNFHSTEYQWLVVNQNGTNAQFKGTGTINGTGEYKFMLWAHDDDPDTFRIRIWEEDENGTETVRYDNGFNQPIGGGSIVIHEK